MNTDNEIKDKVLNHHPLSETAASLVLGLLLLGVGVGMVWPGGGRRRTPRPLRKCM